MDRQAGEAAANQADGAGLIKRADDRIGSGTAQEAARFPRTLSIAIDGKALDNNGAESWLAGKLLEHAVSTAHVALRSYCDLDATITVGDRTATVKVTS